MGSAWPETGLVFTTRTGRPVEPRNLVRSFRRICDANKIRLIKVHHLRHTVGSLLKDLKVPVRDAQTILGHTRISTTLEIYMLTDEPARRDALTRLQGLLDQARADYCYRKLLQMMLMAIFDWPHWAADLGAPGRIRTRDPLLEDAAQLSEVVAYLRR